MSQPSLQISNINPSQSYSPKAVLFRQVQAELLGASTECGIVSRLSANTGSAVAKASQRPGD